MSRSQRKTPIFGMTTARSEKRDKQSWHRALRSREKHRLVGLRDDGEALIPLDENQVMSPWGMAKDGKQYWPRKRQLVMARRIAELKVSGERARKQMMSRLMAKWHAK